MLPFNVCIRFLTEISLDDRDRFLLFSERFYCRFDDIYTHIHTSYMGVYTRFQDGFFFFSRYSLASSRSSNKVAELPEANQKQVYSLDYRLSNCIDKWGSYSSCIEPE
jgi:hypothetical protein